MGKCLKKGISVFIAAVLLLCVAAPVSVHAKSPKVYVYHGGYGNGDGNFIVKYKGNKVYLRGYAHKEKNIQSIRYLDKKPKVKKTYKITKNCKISVGDEKIRTFKFKDKKKVKKYWGKSGKMIKAPSIYVKVKGNKVVWISIGA